MQDRELERLKEWRYTRVAAFDKRPFPKGWQNTPLTLAQVPEGDNIGVLLGEHSGGMMALDFDGESAWSWFAENIGCDLPSTVSWTSGKDARCQMAFTIPAEYWPYITTRKVTTKPADKAAGVKPEQMEFRWNGGQSVVPPSTHPEASAGINYCWVSAPSTTPVAELPEAVLIWLLLQGAPSAEREAPVQGDIAHILDEEFDQLEAVLRQIKEFNPRPDYSQWLSIAYATAQEVGNDGAAILLNMFWPEEVRGEYKRLLRGRDPQRSPTMGTLVKMVKDHQAQRAHGKHCRLRRAINNKNKF